MASGSKPCKTPAGAETNKQAKANSGKRRQFKLLIQSCKSPAAEHYISLLKRYGACKGKNPVLEFSQSRKHSTGLSKRKAVGMNLEFVNN
jgi:hypothetical protein